MKKIALIYPLDTSLPLQSTSYRVFMPRYGVLAIAKRLIDEGYEVRTFCEQSGSEIDWDYVYSCDYFCFSILSFSAFKAYSYTKKLKEKFPDKVIIYGGSHASLAPDDCLNHVDYVIRNEGEESLVDLLNRLENGLSLEGILGCSLNIDGKKVHGKSRPFMQSVDQVVSADLIENYRARTLLDYARDILSVGVPRFNVVVAQSSRGCPFDCSFCFVKIELGKQYRKKTPEMVVLEVSKGIESLKSKYVMFVDNDFCIDRAHSIRILDLLYEKYNGEIDLFIFTRINIALDQQMITAMKRAGNICLAVGIESIDPKTQTEYKKTFQIDHIRECLKTLNENKIKYHALFVVGSDHDTVQTIHDIVDFSVQADAFYMGMQILYDFPYKEKILGATQCVPDARFIHHDWRFFSGTFVTHFPKRIRPSVLQSEVGRAHMKFYRESRYFIQFYATKGILRSYINYLKKIEEGLYTEDDILIEDRLIDFKIKSKISITSSRIDYVLELLRFYMLNITRRDSWSYLFSLLKFTQRSTRG